VEWSFEPGVVVALLLAVLLYALGARKTRPRGKRVAACAAGLLLLAAALFSPIDTLSNELFYAHAIQHTLLMVVCAPLLILGELPLMVLRALPRGWAHGLGAGMKRSWLGRAWSGLTSPVGAWLLFAIAMWLWHAPRFYQAALRNEGLHAFEHLSLLLTSMLFWWVLLRPSAAQHLHYGKAFVYLFTAMLHSTVLGALMTFTSEPWYPYYTASAGAWGWTPMQDQQLAGLIMWMPGGALFSILAIGYFAAWLRALERRSPASRPH
jgi:putative membrane protein